MRWEVQRQGATEKQTQNSHVLTRMARHISYLNIIYWHNKWNSWCNWKRGSASNALEMYSSFSHQLTRSTHWAEIITQIKQCALATDPHTADQFSFSCIFVWAPHSLRNAGAMRPVFISITESPNTHFHPLQKQFWAAFRVCQPPENKKSFCRNRKLFSHIYFENDFNLSKRELMYFIEDLHTFDLSVCLCLKWNSSRDWYFMVHISQAFRSA